MINVVSVAGGFKLTTFWTWASFLPWPVVQASDILSLRVQNIRSFCTVRSNYVSLLFFIKEPTLLIKSLHNAYFFVSYFKNASDYPNAFIMESSFHISVHEIKQYFVLLKMSHSRHLFHLCSVYSSN